MHTTMAGQQVDITNCESEPIHLTSFIQPHGVLFVLRKLDLAILQMSENVKDLFQQAPADLLGKNISLLLPEVAVEIQASISRDEISFKPALIGTYSLSLSDAMTTVDIMLHQQHQGFILELETVYPEENSLPDPIELYGSVFTKLLNTSHVTELSQIACEQMRALSGFDRVMIYRFDEEGAGDVIAEALKVGCDSFLGLHYPQSDIPKQARELYKKNWIRLIPDINNQSVPLFPQINPNDGLPLDQSYCTLRSLSPIHVEYLRNMQVVSSMSVSIIVKDRLWGLIACHHQRPKYISYRARMTYEFLGQVLSTQLFNLEETEIACYRNEMFVKHQGIVDLMANDQDFIQNFYKYGADIVGLVEADGAAFCLEGKYYLYGKTPTKAQVKKMVRWLKHNRQQDLFATKSLSSCYPEAGLFKETASGLLSVAISAEHNAYFLWFRPEIIQIINWAGDPRKPVEVQNGTERLTPRRSFALWKESVSGEALPWSQAQIEVAQTFRKALLNVILAKTISEVSRANLQLAQSNQDLESFASVACHDMQAPLRKAKQFMGHVMEEVDKLKPENQDALQRAKSSMDDMQTLISDVLALARVNRAEGPYEEIHLSQVLKRVLDTLEPMIQEKKAKIETENLSTVCGDPVQIGQLLQNLIENGLKYQPSGQIPIIKVKMDDSQAHFCQIEIEDNGIGFKPEYAERIFEPFERLQGRTAYPGTGIGLAVCKRIVERHGGRIVALGVPGFGSKFIITLPKRRSAVL